MVNEFTERGIRAGRGIQVGHNHGVCCIFFGLGQRDQGFFLFAGKCTQMEKDKGWNVVVT